jgi:hypothetical protein
MKFGKFSLKTISKKGVVFGLSAGVALGLTGAAFAYWTTTGSGNGAASTQAAAATLTLNVSAVSTNLYPGGTAPVTITATNGSNTSLYVTTVSFASLSIDAGHPDCLSTDYTVGTVSTTATRVLANTTSGTVATATLSMADTAANQDGCKGATVTLNFTSV